MLASTRAPRPCVFAAFIVGAWSVVIAADNGAPSSPSGRPGPVGAAAARADNHGAGHRDSDAAIGIGAAEGFVVTIDGARVVDSPSSAMKLS